MNSIFLSLQLIAFIVNCILLGMMIVRLGEFFIQNWDLVKEFARENKWLLISCVLFSFLQIAINL